jgi:glyoxylase-like metal-dependent hydrolase (beta-lactamase superfamily II)
MNEGTVYCDAMLALLLAAVLAPWPEHWIHGAEDCQKNLDPMFQVHEVDTDTYVLRMSKCASPEAPFSYLLLGSRRALLLDSGDEPVSGTSEIRTVVDGILQRRGERELIVAHSHGHGDHRGGDSLFYDRPRTTVVGMTAEDVKAFFALHAWPEGEATLELGDRRLLVLPLPGHQVAHIAVYDPRDHLLLTGDTVYPGLLTIRDWPAYRSSVARLAAFAKAHEVSWVLGAHVEMTARAREMYPLGTTFQPDEHPLQLARSRLDAVASAVAALAAEPQHDVHDDFILEMAEMPRSSVHGMLLFGEVATFASHLPMFHSPHDYQIILEVRLPEDARRAYVADRRATGESVYTLAPTPFVLPSQVQSGAPFTADLYHGHFERGGKVLRSGVTVEIRSVVVYRALEPSRSGDARDRALLFGRGGEAFLAHQIATPPDFDQIASVTLPRGRSAPLHPQAVVAGEAPLRDGQSLADAGTVRRVLYTEHEDLAAP